MLHNLSLDHQRSICLSAGTGENSLVVIEGWYQVVFGIDVGTTGRVWWWCYRLLVRADTFLVVMLVAVAFINLGSAQC